MTLTSDYCDWLLRLKANPLLIFYHRQMGVMDHPADWTSAKWKRYMRNPLLICRLAGCYGPSFLAYRCQCAWRVVYKSALRHFSERFVFLLSSLYFWLRVSSPQLAAASALGPVMWGPCNFSTSYSFLLSWLKYDIHRTSIWLKCELQYYILRCIAMAVYSAIKMSQ